MFCRPFLNAANQPGITIQSQDLYQLAHYLQVGLSGWLAGFQSQHCIHNLPSRPSFVHLFHTQTQALQTKMHRRIEKSFLCDRSKLQNNLCELENGSSRTPIFGTAQEVGLRLNELKLNYFGCNTCSCLFPQRSHRVRLSIPLSPQSLADYGLSVLSV